MINRRAKSFVTIMVVVALAALLLRLAIHRIIIYQIQQNQLLAQVNLKLFSTAMENYAKDNKNTYPVNVDLLTKANPVYLEKDYLAAPAVGGYEYDCQRLDTDGYNCTASPGVLRTVEGSLDLFASRGINDLFPDGLFG